MNYLLCLTIGADPNKTYNPAYKIGVYFWIIYFWIIFGLAFMATVITLIADLIKENGKR